MECCHQFTSPLQGKMDGSHLSSLFLVSEADCKTCMKSLWIPRIGQSCPVHLTSCYKSSSSPPGGVGESQPYGSVGVSDVDCYRSMMERVTVEERPVDGYLYRSITLSPGGLACLTSNPAYRTPAWHRVAYSLHLGALGGDAVPLTRCVLGSPDPDCMIIRGNYASQLTRLRISASILHKSQR